MCMEGFGLISNKCESCPENCELCQTEAHKCDVCKKGYKLDSETHTCKEISKHCYN